MRIETDAACRSAASAAGKTAAPSGNFLNLNPVYPRGCYYVIITNFAFLNIDPVDGSDPGCTSFFRQQCPRLLCAAVTTGTHARHTLSRVHACGRELVQSGAWSRHWAYSVRVCCVRTRACACMAVGVEALYTWLAVWRVGDL